jgi:DNA-binding CsgD family transcriptional regulator
MRRYAEPWHARGRGPGGRPSTGERAPRPHGRPLDTGPDALLDHPFVHALDAVPVGLLFFAADGALLHMNQRALQILDAETGGEPLREPLRLWVRALCAQTPQRPHVEAPALQELEVRELQTPAGRYRLRASGFGTGAARALVVVLEPLTRVELSLEVVRRRFTMTRREAQVALLLAERRATREIALTLGISPHTARHHVRRVFAKLGIHSRREVAGVLEAGLAEPESPE